MCKILSSSLYKCAYKDIQHTIQLPDSNKMLSKGFFYLALLIAKGLLVAEARSTFSPQVEFEHTNEALRIDNSNLYNKKVVPGSIYEASHIFDFILLWTCLLIFEQTYSGGVDIPSSFISDSFKDTAVTIVQNKLGLTDGDVAYNSGYSSDVADYAYLRQSYVCFLHKIMPRTVSFPTRMASHS